MRFIWSILICLVFALPLSAQDKGSQNQQIESVKVAFITQKLNLTSSQAEKFWPVYNNYQREMREVFKQRKEAKNRNDGKDGELDYESRLLDIRKKYKQEFSRAIPSDKVAQFYDAEREFRETMIKELKERRHKQ